MPEAASRQAGRRVVASTLLTALVLAACQTPDVERRLLLDGRLAPDILLEERRLAPPPATGGNRFLSGWQPWQDGETVVLTAGADGGRLELVQLAPRQRTLLVDLLPTPEPTAEGVRVRVAGRELGTFPLGDPLAIPLPADLPEGRLAIDLIPEGGTEPVLHAVAAAVRPALPAGEVRVEGEDLLQTGESAMDLITAVHPGQALVGTLVPPSGASAGRALELTVEDAAGRRLAELRWTAGLLSRLLGPKHFRLPLGDTGGWVRLRLRSRGAGAAARWRGLGLTPAPEPPEPAKKAVGAEGPPSTPPRLVVLYVMDALRAGAVGHLGGRRDASPVLDRLAAEGVTFHRHYAVAPNTLPSTKALFTGRVWLQKGGWKLPPEAPPTLAEAFRAAGFRTALISGNAYVSPAYGMERGFEHVAADVLFEENASAAYNDSAERIHRAALAWLRDLPPGEPALLYLHTIHPHNPYDPPASVRERFVGSIPSRIDGSTATLLDIQRLRLETTAADRERLRGLYAGGLAYNDAELGTFLAELAHRVPPEETFLAVTSDHGEELFDHGGVLHGYTLYEEMLHIPLILWAPGRLAPGRIDAATTTPDLHRILLDLLAPAPPGGAGGAAPGRRGLAARAKEPVSPHEAVGLEGDGEAVHFAAAASVDGGIYSASNGRFKVIWAPRTGLAWGFGEGLGRSRDPEVLFDLRRDSGETRNLAGEPDLEGGLEAAWLRSRLLAWVAQGAAERADGEAPQIDPETRERLRALGYVD